MLFREKVFEERNPYARDPKSRCGMSKLKVGPTTRPLMVKTRGDTEPFG